MTEERKSEIEKIAKDIYLSSKEQISTGLIMEILEREKIKLIDKKNLILKSQDNNIIQIVYFPPQKAIVVDTDSGIMGIAHELGHYFLHNEYKTFNGEIQNIGSDMNIKSREKELEADYFALFLIMPVDLFESVFKNLSEDLYSLSYYYSIPISYIKKRIEYPKGLYR